MGKDYKEITGYNFAVAFCRILMDCGYQDWHSAKILQEFLKDNNTF